MQMGIQNPELLQLPFDGFFTIDIEDRLMVSVYPALVQSQNF